jgi:hypothetical protein
LGGLWEVTVLLAAGDKMLNCNFSKIICSSFPRTVGRPAEGILGIVIEWITEEALNAATAQATVASSTFQNIRGFHYYIGNLGNVYETESIQNSIPNLYFSYHPSINYLPGYDSNTNPNVNPDPYFIYIALCSVNALSPAITDAQYNALVNLICCINQAYNIAVDASHIITPDDLNYSIENVRDYRDFILPASLFADASEAGCTLRASIPESGSGGSSSPGTVIPPIPACCDDNAADIIALSNQVNSLSLLVTSLINSVNSAVPLAQAAYDQAKETAIYLAGLRHCFDCLCPSDLSHGRIEYQLVNENDRLAVLPNVNRWINFPTKITDLIPERVQTGPLWTVQLDQGTYPAEVNLRFSPSDYCVGCKVWLDVVICGVKTRIAQQVILTAGVQVVNLNWSGSLIIPVSGCNDIHFETSTNTTLGTPAYKILECATVKIDVL